MFEWRISIIHHLSNFYPLRVQFKLTTSIYLAFVSRSYIPPCVVIILHRGVFLCIVQFYWFGANSFIACFNGKLCLSARLLRYKENCSGVAEADHRFHKITDRSLILVIVCVGLDAVLYLHTR